MHAALNADHPGAIDTQNPAFRISLDEGLQAALSMAQDVTDQGGLLWGLRAYAARFDDAHLTARLSADAPRLSQRWPGFLTAYRGGRYVVATKDNMASPQGPPIGAVLVDCDGRPAETFARDRLAPFFGRWFLESQKVETAPWLFRDAMNPWAPPPARCRFETDAGVTAYDLAWRSVDTETLSSRLREIDGGGEGQIGLRAIQGGLWISLGSFEGDPSTVEAKALHALISDIGERRDQLRTSSLIVLDLRGNGGGSSSWSREIAALLWSPDWIAANRPPAPTAVDWRASDGNIAALEAYAAEYAAGGNADGAAYFGDRAAALRRAKDQGHSYWSEPLEQDDESVEGRLGRPLDARVLIVTDSGCFSACLDAVDLWKALGAVQVGRTTGADTVYIENRNLPLPSGMTAVNFSMKVYRGRTRGHNVPQVPTHVFDGAIENDEALLTWIRGL